MIQQDEPQLNAYRCWAKLEDTIFPTSAAAVSTRSQIEII